MVVHIVYWKLAGRALAPLEFNEVLFTVHQGIITAGFILMAITVIATLIFGRFFCSWGCHILALQDLSAWLLEKINIKPKQIKSRFFILIPVIAVLYLFGVPIVEKLYYGMPFVQLKITTDKDGWASFITANFWRNLPSPLITTITFITVGFGTVYFLGSRSFCQYGCPYGVLFAGMDRLSRGKIVLTGDCNQCGICTTVCNSHIQVHQEVNHFSKVVDHNCLKDLDCVASCPTNALEYGFTKPSFFKSLSQIKSIKKKYTFSLREELIAVVLFFIFFFIYRGLYNTIPFLLALSLGLIFSFLTIWLLRLFSYEYVPLGTIVLKQAGKFSLNGKFFISLSVFMLLFSGYHAFYQYHYLKGKNLLSGASADIGNLAAANTSVNNQTLTEAKKHFEFALKYGLFTPASLSRYLATISIYEKNYPLAIQYLKQVVTNEADDIEAKNRLAKLLISTQNEIEAVPVLTAIINYPLIFTAKEYAIKSEAELMLGHIEEKNRNYKNALAHYQNAIKDNADNADALLATAILLSRSKNFIPAENYFNEYQKLIPESAIAEAHFSMMLIAQKRYDEALAHTNKLIHLEPQNYIGYYNKGLILFNQNKISEAIAPLEFVLKLKPDFNGARDLLSKIYANGNESSLGKSENEKSDQLKSNFVKM